MRRAVLLGRVSTNDHGQEPESQLQPLRAAADRLGWTVVEEVALELSAWDETAAAEVRRRALWPIEQGRADTLMIWAWDRFSRQGIEGAFTELRYLEQHLGAALWSLQEPFLCTATSTREQRELLLALVAWHAKWESQRRSERLRARVASKRSKASQLGQRARWGRGKLASTEDAHQVHELAATHSIREIASIVGISKSQVQRLLACGVPIRPEGQSESQTG